MPDLRVPIMNILPNTLHSDDNLALHSPASASKDMSFNKGSIITNNVSKSVHRMRRQPRRSRPESSKNLENISSKISINGSLKSTVLNYTTNSFTKHSDEAEWLRASKKKNDLTVCLI